MDILPDYKLLLTNYNKVRQASLVIAEPLSEQDMQIQSMPEASPTKWHLAHTSWAFETFIIKPHLNNYKVFNPQFEYLFNSYYNAIGRQFPRAQRGLLSRPSYQEILQYRQHIDVFMTELIEAQSDLNHSLINLIRLVINHEQQHQELMLTDIKHALFINPYYPVYCKSTPPKYFKTSLNWKNYDADLYQIGHSHTKQTHTRQSDTKHDHIKHSHTKHSNIKQNHAVHNQDDFYFDNEGPQHQVYLQPFKIASRLVSNAEFLEFVKNGGYQESSFWLSEAWANIIQQQLTAPYYWVKKNNSWYQYTSSGLQPLELDAPVMHVNYFEASAFANSLNKRLPTEQEWEVACIDVSVEGTFFDRTNMHPKSSWNAESSSGVELQQMFGELWQWTSSSYNAYPGFKPVEGAIGEYNGKFMVNQYVLRGGSIATPQDHIRPSYRNFFYPDASWQYTGIRLADNL